MQDLLAILIALAAATFLVRRAWQHITRRSAGACGSCASCPSSTSLRSQPLISIDQLTIHNR
jgi:hypothetical protein